MEPFASFLISRMVGEYLPSSIPEHEVSFEAFEVRWTRSLQGPSCSVDALTVAANKKRSFPLREKLRMRFSGFSYFRSFFRRVPRPTKPKPSNERVAGSGVVTTGAATKPGIEGLEPVSIKPIAPGI
jgi:hypothetical protein